MNRELYIHTLRMLREQYEIARMDTVVETIDAALAEFERTTDSDCISRQAAIDGVKTLHDVAWKNWHEPTLSANVVLDMIRELPSAQPDLQQTCNQLATDCISRQATIDAIFNEPLYESGMKKKDADAVVPAIYEKIKSLPSAQPEPQWIPFKTRPLTEEEKEEYPEWNCILDCKLPDDGQAILVSINRRGHERVQYDEFYSDDGSYLDSGYTIGEEATAWMPLPEPYKEKDNERA